MAVRVSDTIKQQNDNTDFPVVEGDAVQVTISDSKMYLQDAIDNNLIGGGNSNIVILTEEEYNALDSIDSGTLYCITDATYTGDGSGSVIDDDNVSTSKTYSSSKIVDYIDSLDVGSSIINDDEASESKTYSSNKISQMINEANNSNVTVVSEAEYEALSDDEKASGVYYVYTE